MTASTEELRDVRDRIRALAAAQKVADLTASDALVFMARAEMSRGSNIAAIQEVLRDLTPHLTEATRASWWWALKDAIDHEDPPCRIAAAMDRGPGEDYDTPLSMALKVLRGVL